MRDILRHIRCLKNEVPRLLSLVLRSRILTTSGTGFFKVFFPSVCWFQVSRYAIPLPLASNHGLFSSLHICQPDVHRHWTVLILALQLHLSGLLCCSSLACARQDVRDISRHIRCLKNKVPRLLSLVLRSRFLTTSDTGFSRISFRLFVGFKSPVSPSHCLLLPTTVYFPLCTSVYLMSIDTGLS